MPDIEIRTDRRAGRITFNRPDALNALSHEMTREIDRALIAWRGDPDVLIIIIDATGDRAFCAGGDVGVMYRAGIAGDHQLSRDFFRDEYILNARIADYPKQVVAFMQGFVLGGGVGIGGHASHRIVGDTTQIAMPEAGIGLIPDVGGSWLLGHAPGRMGEYLGLTAARMGPGDAILAGFADYYLPEAAWPQLIDELSGTADVNLILPRDVPAGPIGGRDLAAFAGDTVGDIIAALETVGDGESLQQMRRNSPLSMAATLALVRAARNDASVRDSLAREYRFTARATEESDFLEGVRAQIIDKDRRPHWAADAGPEHVAKLLAPLGDNEMSWDNTQ